jgi:type IV pilus assembly protein PilW
MNKIGRAQTGFGLIELMVAIAISLLLFAGVLNIFLSSKQTYRGQSALSRLQENGRKAIDFLSQDIRMAGYSGCQRIPSSKISNTLNTPTQVSYNFTVAVQGFNDLTTSLPAELTGLSPSPLVGTDVMVVRGPIAPSVPVLSNNNGAQLFASVLSQEAGACAGGTDRISGICQGDILMISDCRKARVFQAGPITVAGTVLNITHPASGTPGNNPSSWGGASTPPDEQFPPPAEITPVASRIYYVATGANGRPSLFRASNGGAGQELVEGVEDLQIVYGVDTNADRLVDQYVAADAVTNWENAVSARAHLLLQSPDANTEIGPTTVFFNNANQPFTDRRMRHGFTTTVGVRNRLP